MQSPPTESQRIVRLRKSIIQFIPRFPNTKESLSALKAKGLADLLITYANFASRSVPPRKRIVSIDPTVTSDRRWKSLSGNITALLDKARNGEDLNPYLSLGAHKDGYTPPATGPGQNVKIWADKDLVLNVMGFHHFHLSLELEESGISKRTNDVLFATLTRNSFIAIGIFDHSVFYKTADQPELQMTLERKRLYSLYDQHLQRGRPAGAGYLLSSAISTAGTTINHSMQSIQYVKIIREFDPKLDDPEFRQTVLKPVGNSDVRKHKLEWMLNYLDLGVHNKTTEEFYILAEGPT